MKFRVGNRTVSKAALSVALISAMFASPVAAQNNADASTSDAAGQNDTDENVILVTARLRDESLTEVPVAVSVATAEQLERDQVYTLVDLQKITPALEVSSSFGGNINGGAGLRGIRTQAFNPSVSPSVAIVVDQAAAGNVTFPILHDLAQVEVLRGPQGTLFGQGASAGVVNISTRAPSLGEFGVNFGLDYADDGTAGSENTDITARAGVNIPLGQIAALRISGLFSEIDGLRTNTFLNLDDRNRKYAIRGRLLVEPSDTITINLIADHGKQDEDGVNFFGQIEAPSSTAPFPPAGPNATVGGVSTNNFAACGVTADLYSDRGEFFCEDTQSREDATATSLTAIVDAELTDRLSITSVTSYRELKLEIFGRNFGGRAIGFSARDENLQGDYKQFSQELRFGYEGDGFDLIAGGYYSDFGYDQSPLDSSLAFSNPTPGQRLGFSVCQPDIPVCAGPDNLPTFELETADNRTIAVFADVTVTLSDQVELFGGLRFTDYKNDSSYGTNTLTATDVGSISETNLSGRVGLSYQPTPDSNIYASYSRGYKPSALGFPGIPGDPFIPLDAEENDAFEIGAKAEVGRLQLAGNIFYMNVANFQGQESITTPGGLVSQVRNIGDVESYGFEVSAFGQITDNISINAGYQFNHATYPQGFAGDDASDLSGEQLLSAPRHKFTLSGEFTQPVGDSLEVFFNPNIIYKSAIRLSNRDPGNRFVHPAGENVSLRLGLRDEDAGWTASLFARNLTKNREVSAFLPTVFGGRDDGGLRGRPVSGLTTRLIGISLGFEY
ncbi:TonB-dependent receptor [Parasphingorhabdus sp.]|uniref:TonB-dependent receptor n=1 Tax=Parasphingorhabdus sp. TaxID=2709688 RepID=UPI003BB05AE1